ncbi:MAG: hypothetical protein RBT74_05550 [Tenuifilaceae bacterium]|jgi:hypothetical protein|nr:hypothetical protein [Tenuifilaceae bacterium]
MKKIVVILVIIVALVLSTFLGLHIGWRFKEKRVLNVYILDKTVTRSDRPEHKSLIWVLNTNRFVLPNQKSYNNTEDYYGFFPIDIKKEAFDFRSIRINEVDTYAAIYDVAYYADCYGVHSFEWYKGKSKPISSQKIYGGLNQNDYLLMKKMLENGKLVIGEYNIFSSPTNALVRSKTEELLGISWSGWSGRYFPTLNIDASNGPPPWMKNLFESQHMGVWPKDKSGIVLVNNDGLIEILVEGVHLNSSLPITTSTNEALTRFGIKQNIPFEQWFEFINPLQNTVHSEFKLDVTQLGEETLSRMGLSSQFPAIIEGRELGKFFYFCGDFAENPAQLWTAKIVGGNRLNHFLYRFDTPNRSDFFRYFYNPLITNILQEHYSNLK